MKAGNRGGMKNMAMSVNGPSGFGDGGLCMVLWASTDSLTGVKYSTSI